MSRPSSPFPSCFYPSSTSDDHDAPHAPPKPPPPPPLSGNPNLTTCLYHTDAAVFSLTWSRSFIGRSLHVTLLHHAFLSPPPSPAISAPSLHLQIKPLVFWKKHGSKRLLPNVRLFYDLTKARFGSGPEPVSGFFIAAVVDGELALIVGDLTKEATAKVKAKPVGNPEQALVLRREHVVAKRIYSTRAKFGGKSREIEINCGGEDCSRLIFSVDGKKILQIKRLKWKFRGNERVEIDGVSVQISWDVYNWLFDSQNDDSHAVFMFRFDDETSQEKQKSAAAANSNNVAVWAHQQAWNLGMTGIEWRKIGKSASSSSVSMSSAGSSAGSSSVMEWASMEESELSAGPSGFTLMVYAWRR